MEKSLNPSIAPTCPYIGLKNDPRAFFSYPSTGNCCYHCRPPSVPLLAHQEVYCLRGAHADCPVYRQAENRPFPPQFKMGGSQHVARFGSTRKVLAFFIGILVLGLVGAQYFRQYVAPLLMAPSQTAPTDFQPPATVMPTYRPAPTSTLIPPTTSIPQVHALEVPINAGDHKFLIHRVTGGQTFEMLAATYTTTAEVIRALNYSMKPSLWANTMIVISPGLQSVDPELPAFQAHEVTEAETTIDELAGKLKVAPALLRHYNACEDNCRLAVGDWLIVPISK